MKLPFEKRVKEFNEERNLHKFNTNRVGIDFSDCRSKACWFKYNYDEIERRARELDEGCIKILLQFYASYKRDEEKAKEYTDLLEVYNVYKNLPKPAYTTVPKNVERNIKLYARRLMEFMRINDVRKYDSVSYDDLRFSDGTLVNYWFSANKYRVLENKDIKDEYIKIKGPLRLDFYEKVKEFEKETNMDKYKATNKELKFSDGVMMGPWFNTNNYKVIKYSPIIRDQYFVHMNCNIRSNVLYDIYKYYDYDLRRCAKSKKR